jgi:hypothetical protein
VTLALLASLDFLGLGASRSWPQLPDRRAGDAGLAWGVVGGLWAVGILLKLGMAAAF